MAFSDARGVLTTEQIQAIQVATQGKLLDPATEKSLRSVFVGNIPNDVTEDQLKEIFSQVGPVLSFRIVYDKESGKAKGYGFAEYPDQETAQSAMRNLNNYDLSGRILRVDHASSEKSKEELRLLAQAVTGKADDSPYGDAVEPAEAPEEISKAVASLPPEQMFELMRQMKACIKNNPAEARTMLLQNPQLAYALLQAQVVMKIVDPKAAVELLHRVSTKVDAIRPMQNIATPQMPTPGAFQPNLLPQMHTNVSNAPNLHSNEPWRQNQPQDPRARPMGMDFQTQPMMGGSAGPGNQQGPMPVASQMQPMTIGMSSMDPRNRMPTSQPSVPGPSSGAPTANMAPGSVPPPAGETSSSTSSEAEKAKVISQVMKLSDAQINQLPPEQRQSIIALREQILKSQKRWSNTDPFFSYRSLSFIRSLI